MEKEDQYMLEKDIPYMVYKGTMARFERTIKRLLITLAIAIVLLCASNFYWAYIWCHCDYEEVIVDSQDGGNANYIGTSGVITNGQGNSEKANAKE